jgi:hypothetical protein
MTSNMTPVFSVLDHRHQRAGYSEVFPDIFGSFSGFNPTPDLSDIRLGQFGDAVPAAYGDSFSFYHIPHVPGMSPLIEMSGIDARGVIAAMKEQHPSPDLVPSQMLIYGMGGLNLSRGDPKSSISIPIPPAGPQPATIRPDKFGVASSPFPVDHTDTSTTLEVA